MDQATLLVLGGDSSDEFHTGDNTVFTGDLT